MGKHEEIRVPNLKRYGPEFNKDGTEKHITCEGARYHVISYHFKRDYKGVGHTELHCSCENCEINKLYKE